MQWQWKVCAAALMIVGLAACKQIINRGPVGGADITVTDLRTGEQVYSVPGGTASKDSIIADEGQAEWDTASDIRRMRKLGRHLTHPGSPPFEDGRWYVIAASGGADFDLDLDGVVDSDTGTQVQGTLHAIVLGERLNTNYGFTVSPLTEGAYRLVIDNVDLLSDAELQQALDELAPEVVADADNSGGVDYTDLIINNRFFNTDTQLPEKDNFVLALADSVSVGLSEEDLDTAARDIFGVGAPNIVAEKIYETSIHSEVVEGKLCRNCHYPGGTGSVGSDNDLVPPSDPAYVSKNTQNFRALVEAPGKGVQYVLNKVQGMGHGGGVRIPSSDPLFDEFEAWLNLL